MYSRLFIFIFFIIYLLNSLFSVSQSIASKSFDSNFLSYKSAMSSKDWKGALYFLNNCKAIAEKDISDSNLVKVYLGIANVYKNQNEMEKAMSNFVKAKKLIEVNDYKSFWIELNLQMADFYFDLYELEPASMHLYAAINEINKYNYTYSDNYIRAFILLCRINISNKNTDLALEYINKCFDKFDFCKDKTLITEAYYYKGISLVHSSNFSEALVYLLKSKQFSDQYFYFKFKSTINLSIGDVYLKLNNFDLASKYYQFIVDDISSDDMHVFSLAQSNLAYIKLKEDNFESGYKLILVSDSIASRYKYLDVQLQNNLSLYHYFKRKRSYKKALMYHELAIAIEDSLFTKEKFENIMRLESEYKLVQKENEIELLKKDQLLKSDTEKIENLITEFLVIVTISVAIIFIFIVVFISQKRKIEKLKALRGMNRIANLNSHGVRAPIATILGLISLFNKDKLDDPINLIVIDKLKDTTINLDVVIKDIISETHQISTEISPTTKRVS